MKDIEVEGRGGVLTLEGFMVVKESWIYWDDPLKSGKGRKGLGP